MNAEKDDVSHFYWKIVFLNLSLSKNVRGNTAITVTRVLVKNADSRHTESESPGVEAENLYF